MSLLMDALKRAEEAKRVAEGAAPQPEASAPPTATRTPAAVAAADATIGATPAYAPAKADRDAASRMALIEEDMGEPLRRAPGARATVTAPDPAELARERELAQNLFSAKQPDPPSNKPFYWTVGLGTSIAVVVIGAYFWYQLQPASITGVASVPNPPQATQQMPALTAPPQPPIRLAARSPSVVPPADSQPSLAQPAPEARAPAPLRSSTPPPVEPSPIRVSKPVARIDPGVSRAYKHFAEGNVAAAAADYTAALKADPNNGDALHGMAAVSLHQGQIANAEAYYRRALLANPKDAAAQAALIGMQSQGDQTDAETRLRLLVAEQPQDPNAHFTLGNLYARQARWREAQQAYFKALTGDADNPDYHFNLAVSLDQLGQGALAGQYYRSALASARQRPASFDSLAVAARLGELQQ